MVCRDFWCIMLCCATVLMNLRMRFRLNTMDSLEEASLYKNCYYLYGYIKFLQR